MMRVLLPIVLFSFLSLNCIDDSDPESDAKAIQILFVGNSLTYVNDLPQLVKQIAKKRGVSLKTQMLAFPNYALEDHWNEGKLQELLASERFSYVIIQQGPSSQADGRAMLLDYGARIKSLCDKHDAALAFYMVWPARVNYQTFEGVINNYSEAAMATNSILCPVGEVWKAHMDASKDYSYYGPDQFHPSIEGSKVAAKVIVESLFMQKKY